MVDIAATSAAIKLSPVSLSRFPYQSGGTAGVATMGRRQYYFPKGGKNIRLMLSGVYAGAQETSFTVSVPATFSCAIAPATWDPTVTYQPGDTVVYYATSGGGGSYANNPYWTCATQNTNSPPKPGNTNWSAGSRPTALPVTFDGAPDGTLPTQTLPSGSTVTKPLLVSDVLPVQVPVGGWLEVWQWVNNTNGIYPAGHHIAQLLGPGRVRSAGQADYTLTANQISAGDIGTVTFDPMVVGVPLVATPTVGIIGDSIGDGVTGTSGLNALSIVSGGTGFQVGDLLSIPAGGQTAGAMSAGSSATWIVESVSAGVITGGRIVDPGSYTNVSSQTGQSLPSGTLNLVTLTGSGTGATATPTFASAEYDVGDRLGAIGFAHRGVTAAGLPSIGFCAAGDRANLWATRSYSRLAAIARACPSTFIIELGRNDLTNGDSAATILTNLQKIATNVRALGAKKVFVCTVTPETTSTTAAGQSTFADQSLTGNDAARQTLNTALRAVPSWADGCIDIAAAVEGTGGNLGKWSPIGGLPAAADGKHPGPSALALMAAVVQAAAPQFAI